MRDSDTVTFERRLNALIQKADVPGLALATIRQNELVYTGCFGVADRVSRKPISPNTVFEAASLSKPVVAYATLQLCAEGLLELDGFISSFLDKKSDGQLNGVTVRHALSHSSGLPNWLAEGATPHTRFTSGSRFAYSGVGYRLIQRVIETVTGQPFAEYVEQSVLHRLFMNDSSFVWRADFDQRCATGHDSHGQPVRKLQPLEAHAAFSLHSTAADLARFLIARANFKMVDGVYVNHFRGNRVETTGGLQWSESTKRPKPVRCCFQGQEVRQRICKPPYDANGFVYYKDV